MGEAFLHGNGGGGGAVNGLNFKVVGGTTQPASASENTIWVNTDQDITGWYFSPVQHESMAEGEVWFTIGTSSAVAFNALKKNSLQVYPLSAKQYVSGALVDVKAQIYQGGEWVDWTVYLYNSGDENESFTGGWTATACYQGRNDYGPIGGAGEPTITRNAGNMTITQSGSSDSGLVHTANMIDLSEYKTLKMKGSIYSAWTDPATGIFVRTKLDGYYATDYSAKYTPESVNTLESGEFSVDISNLMGNYYVCIGVGQYSGSTGSEIVMNSMWLEE